MLLLVGGCLAMASFPQNTMSKNSTERWSIEKAQKWSGDHGWLRGSNFNPGTATNWGLVAGKSNTKYAWDKPINEEPEPKLWFNEIFRPDGTPYKQEETDLVRKLTKGNLAP